MPTGKICERRKEVAPARERGLKSLGFSACYSVVLVAPARERGLKFSIISYTVKYRTVAPARERGLKCQLDSHRRVAVGTSLPRGSVD